MIRKNLFQGILVSLCYVLLNTLLVQAAIHIPGEEFNAAPGQIAHASSYYDYTPNVIQDVVFIPQNAIDGFVDESSWWSSGQESIDEKVWFQLNLTSVPTKIVRIVIRWHGYLTPSSYKIRTSQAGENFQTIAVVNNRSILYDRVDVITQGVDKFDTRSRFLRVIVDNPNVCKDAYSCDVDGGTAALGQTNEVVVYGIRELEVWATGSLKNAAIGRVFSFNCLMMILMSLWWIS